MTLETQCTQCGETRDLIAYPECQTCWGAGKVRSKHTLEREARAERGYHAEERRAEQNFASLDYRRELRGWKEQE